MLKPRFLPFPKWCLVGTILLPCRPSPTAYCLVGYHCSLLGSLISAKSTDSLVDISTYVFGHPVRTEWKQTTGSEASLNVLRHGSFLRLECTEASESSLEAGRFEASALPQVKLFNHSQKFHILPATASNPLSSVIHLKLMK